MKPVIIARETRLLQPNILPDQSKAHSLVPFQALRERFANQGIQQLWISCRESFELNVCLQNSSIQRKRQWPDGIVGNTNGVRGSNLAIEIGRKKGDSLVACFFVKRVFFAGFTCGA
jgi:hypothetical protein